MKKIFSIFLVCCSALIYADETPVFEESNDNVKLYSYAPFSAEEPTFDEDEKADESRPCDDKPCPRTFAPFCTENDQPPREGPKEEGLRFHARCSSWNRYKSNFGMEKLFMRFPQRPAVTQNNSLLTAYAYDNSILYSVTGYFPPISHIDPIHWFDDVLYSIDHHPYALVSHVIFQAGNGDWILDYTSHDYVQNLILKGRVIVTPFNGYTLQCVKPNGMSDYFDYFVDNFWIKCECP